MAVGAQPVPDDSNHYPSLREIKFEGRLRKLEVTVSQLHERDVAVRALLDSMGSLTDAKFVTFRTLLDSGALQVKLALDAASAAISKQEASLDKRFEGVNEFRSTLSDQATHFASRSDIESVKEILDRRMIPLERWQASEQGQAKGVSQSVAIVLGGFGLVGTLLAIAGGLAALVR